LVETRYEDSQDLIHTSKDFILVLTFPTITQGKSKISLFNVKQTVQGTGRKEGLIRITDIYTPDSALSKACWENFSQYSIADPLSIS
jgi:hypothetical protein